MFNCGICKNILDYNITLKSLNMKNNLSELPEGMKIGIKTEFLNIKEDNNNLVIPFSLDVVGISVNPGEDEIQENNLKTEIEKAYEENDENLAFKINVIYNLDLVLENSLNEDEKKSSELRDYAYFLLEPTLRDLVASVGGKIGLPGLTLPKKNRNIRNGNNN
ncbi:hypothetical protein [Clostridium perfringens]|uniref:Preprotein translocase subunit SecB n=1 Tax=Clostridium perfringens TaxID=1502 RepID=A0AAE8FRP1_CLOPF|nr:hypothetical protein [Clostridium perfringens]MDK2999579.1 hypothetical protein [Clostridium perfringens]RQN24201.1 hypothetical protein EHZ11_09370 [Clostridium perfringens]